MTVKEHSSRLGKSCVFLHRKQSPSRGRDQETQTQSRPQDLSVCSEGYRVKVAGEGGVSR